MTKADVRRILTVNRVNVLSNHTQNFQEKYAVRWERHTILVLVGALPRSGFVAN